MHILHAGISRIALTPEVIAQSKNMRMRMMPFVLNDQVSAENKEGDLEVPWNVTWIVRSPTSMSDKIKLGDRLLASEIRHALRQGVELAVAFLRPQIRSLASHQHPPEARNIVQFPPKTLPRSYHQLALRAIASIDRAEFRRTARAPP